MPILYDVNSDKEIFKFATKPFDNIQSEYSFKRFASHCQLCMHIHCKCIHFYNQYNVIVTKFTTYFY